MCYSWVPFRPSSGFLCEVGRCVTPTGARLRQNCPTATTDLINTLGVRLLYLTVTALAHLSHLLEFPNAPGSWRPQKMTHETKTFVMVRLQHHFRAKYGTIKRFALLRSSFYMKYSENRHIFHLKATSRKLYAIQVAQNLASNRSMDMKLNSSF